MMLSVIGNKKISDETAIKGQIVCFCDIPLAGLDLHMKKYSRFGLAFSKAFLVAMGANPVFYVVRDGIVPGFHVMSVGPGSAEMVENPSRAELLDRLHSEAMALSDANYDLIADCKDPDLRSRLLRTENLRSLIYEGVLAFIKPFDSTEPEDGDNNYYMEREWRVFGSVEFTLADVSRVILPPAYVAPYKREFPAFSGAIESVL
jgi:hypothetical protein